MKLVPVEEMKQLKQSITQSDGRRLAQTQNKSQIKSLDFKVDNVLEDMIQYIIAIVVLIVLIMLLLCLMHTSWRRLSPKIRSILLKIKAKLMYNSVLRVVLQSYYGFLLSSLFAFKYTVIGDDYGSIQSKISAVVILIALIGFNVFAFFFMRKNRDRLSQKTFRSSYGSLYVPGETHKKEATLWYPVLFCLRRLLTGIVIVMLTGSVLIQIHLAAFLSLLMTTWALATLPMDSTTNNWLFLYNEFFVLFSCDLVLIFTEYSSERDPIRDIENKY